MKYKLLNFILIKKLSILICCFFVCNVYSQLNRPVIGFDGGPIFNFTSSKAMQKTNYGLRMPNGNIIDFPFNNYYELAYRNNGSLLFLSNSILLFRPINKLISNGDSLGYIYNNAFVQDSFQSYYMLVNNIVDNETKKSISEDYCNYAKYLGMGACFDSCALIKPAGLYGYKINASFYDNAIVNKNKYNNIIYKFINNTSIYGTSSTFIKSVRRLNNFNYRFLHTELFKDTSKSINSEILRFKVLDKTPKGLNNTAELEVNIRDYLPDSVKNNPLYVSVVLNNYDAQLSRLGNKIIANFNVNSYISIKYNIYESRDILVFYDIINKSIVVEKIIVSDPYYSYYNVLKKPYTSKFIPKLGIITAHDSFMYTNDFGYANYDSNGLSVTGSKSTKIKYNYYTHSINKDVFQWKDNLYYLSLNPYGNVTSDPIQATNSKLTLYHFNIDTPTILSKDTFNNVIFYAGNFNKYQVLNYIFIEKTAVVEKCGVRVKLTNKSNEALGLGIYKWYYTTDSTWQTFDSIVSKDLEVTLPLKSGYFNFRMHALSTKNTYSEWYEDTMELNIPIKEKLSNAIIPRLKYASIQSAKQAKLAWVAEPLATKYAIYRNGQKISTTADTFFIETFATDIKSSHTYYVIAEDDCQNRSAQSNISKLIILKTEVVNNNNAIYLPKTQLNWNPYITFTEGVKGYELQTKYKNETTETSTPMLQNNNYTDDSFLNIEKVGKCYKIKAISNKNYESNSNWVCNNYNPLVFIPTAVSADNNGLNDLFYISSIGLENITFNIYNRWGSVVYKSNTSGIQQFPNNTIPSGVYAYKLQAIANNKPYYFTGTITVLK